MRADPFQAGSTGADVGRFEDFRIAEGRYSFAPGDLLGKVQYSSEAIAIAELHYGKAEDFDLDYFVTQLHSIQPGSSFTLARRQHSVSRLSCRLAHSSTAFNLFGGKDPASTSYKPNVITTESSPIRACKCGGG